MIKDIVIVGGGFAGYMTGLLIKRAFGTDLWPELTITVIESSSIGTVGVGESTAQNIPTLLDKIEIDPYRFMKAANGTFKMSGRFDNWNFEGESFHHVIYGIDSMLDLYVDKPKPILFDFYDLYHELSILYYLATKDSGELGFDNLCLENELVNKNTLCEKALVNRINNLEEMKIIHYENASNVANSKLNIILDGNIPLQIKSNIVKYLNAVIQNIEGVMDRIGKDNNRHCVLIFYKIKPNPSGAI